MEKFIPIIGTISAGKTTFLQGLLGTDVLETGATTTTKFVCIIKNSVQTKFYHVIPKRENFIKFIKEGEEIIGEEKIKNEIQDINKTLKDKPISNSNLFYMLEIPIKNINNPLLLNECYFMDIPGLNENENSNSYIEIIFSFLTLDDIKFEIMVFDSTNIGSDSIINIIKNIDKKKCLKKSGNLFILNKIDRINQNTEEEIINKFKQYFYHNFEDDKEENPTLINISENKFIPMNSLSFLAETKFYEDFHSMLKVQFFNFIELKNKDQIKSFKIYLDKILEFTLKMIDNENISINLDINSITKDEFEIIENCVKEINNLKKKLNSNVSVDIKLKKDETKNMIIKLFLIHKNKSILYFYLKYYTELKLIIEEINKNKNDLLPMENQIENPYENENQANNNKMINSLMEFENFLNDIFKKIDPFNELNYFLINVQSLREGILGRKIRIAFIGNISVGKSTVLNCIIGEDILPTNDTECTYRGIIIRHVKGGKFKLFKTKFETRGKGSDEYYYFVDEKKPYREGIKDIKEYLNIKNNDKKIKDNDAYLVITGNLKIFDFINLDNELISKLEFIDLPGIDKKDNEFNKKSYYKKILRFSNCCVYINEPKTLDDDLSVSLIANQYISDKQKILPAFRENFIKTCLFLINKTDTLEKEEEKTKLKENLLRKISKLEEKKNEKDINISFFSGELFLKYLKVRKDYVYLFENKPKTLFSKLFEEYEKNKIYLLNNFKKFIYEKIEQIEEDLFQEEENEIEEEDKDKEKTTELKKEINSIIKDLEKNKYKLLDGHDLDEIFEKMYNLNKRLKKTDFSNTYYSPKFFDDLKHAIENSDKLYKDNLKKNIENFFDNTDILFKKEVDLEKKQDRDEKEALITKCNEMSQIILEIFDNTEKNFKSIFNIGRDEIFRKIHTEQNNIKAKLSESGNDIKMATEKLRESINLVIQDMVRKLNEEMIKLIEVINKEVGKRLNEKEFRILISNFDSNIGLVKKILLSLLSSTLITYLGETALSEVITTSLGATAGGAVGGPIGIAIGFGVGLVIGLATYLIHSFRKESRYEKGLINFKQQMENNLYESEENCLRDLSLLREDFLKEIRLKLNAYGMDIINIDEETWEKLKKDYDTRKNQIKEIINDLK